jgi:hypothetical protein
MLVWEVEELSRKKSRHDSKLAIIIWNSFSETTSFTKYML